jgi:hypothetical protein
MWHQKKSIPQLDFFSRMQFSRENQLPDALPGSIALPNAQTIVALLIFEGLPEAFP